MSDVAALDSLYEDAAASPLPLPPALSELYGQLSFPDRPLPHVIGNFVSTLDGVVALDVPGHAGGADISGFSKQDQFVMGLLRATADAVVVGAGTLRSVPKHRWTAAHIAPAFAPAYDQLRAALGKFGPPLNVIVTGKGDVDLGLPVFTSGDVPVLIVTTEQGAQRLREQATPPSVSIASVTQQGSIGARAILEQARAVRPCAIVLVEGGPHLMGDFFEQRALDELFLTLAPQVAGRDASSTRPGLVEGALFAPDNPRWGQLTSVKRGGGHLFLRYRFERA